MNDEQYLLYGRELLAELTASLVQRTQHLPVEDPLLELARAYESLAQRPQNIYREGPALISRMFTTYPELAPTVPRHLLWFLGGDCLHFMAEEEITLFQQLDDLRAEASARGELFNPREARAKLLNLQ